MPPVINPPKNMHLRRGISLLEVLISMFTLSVGLLGMASLIAVGTHHSSNAARLDHASACGQAALRNIRVHHMLEPSRWNSSTAVFDTNNQARPFVIDPLGINGGASSNIFPDVSGAAYQMPRVQISTAPNNQNVFVWQSEVASALPAGDEEGRPTLQVSSGSYSGGHYSWMAMVEPSRSENFAQLAPSSRRLYNVAVAVFYQRDLDVLEEQQFDAQLTGGGGVTITGAGDSIEPGQWILLSSQWQAPNDSQPTSAESRQFHRWYRVLNVSQHPSNGDVFVMLSGPTWPNNALENGVDAKATIVPGVVAVYERSLELDVAF